VDLGLQGKKALVTGGSRGIGRAIVELLVDEGCSVAFCARGADGVQEAVASLRQRGTEPIAAAVDVGDAEAYKSWLAEAVEGLGGLDILVCNATGYVKPGEEGWNASFDVDMMGLVRAVEVTLPALEASGAGAILSISSTAALDVFLPGLDAYGAMKAAVVHHTAVMAHDHGPKGIRCNALAPGPIEFPGNGWEKRREQGHPLYEAMCAGSPFGRLGNDKEVANAAVFLVSPAASWINGVNLVIDGGLTKRVNY
jgi:NAD(P)-dependent dehydrogenase (short-subunit alcohol dehydrogenase family)